MKIRRHYIFHGRVQGVGFRFTVYRLATHLGLTGWVKNNYDGTVEAIIQGENTHVVELLRHLYDDDYISISHIDMEELKVLSEETSFTVKY